MGASNTVVLNALWEGGQANRGIATTNSGLDRMYNTATKIGNQGAKQLDNFSRKTQNIGAGFKTGRTEIDLVHDSIKKLAGVLGPLGEFFTKALTIPLGLIGFAAFEARRKLDTLERGLTSIVGSGEFARAKLQELAIVAQSPGLDFVNTVQGVSRLVAAGLGMGTATKAVKEFGNALALVGGTQEDFAGVTLALQQISSKAKVSAEEVNQIAERIPATRQLILRAFGTTDTEQLQRAGVTPRQFISAIVDEAAKLPRATSSLANEFKNFKDSLLRSFNEIGVAIEPLLKSVFQRLTSAINDITRGFNNLSNFSKNVVVTTALLAATLGPLLVGLNLVRNAVSAVLAGKEILTAAFVRSTVSITAETAALTANTAAKTANAGAGAGNLVRLAGEFRYSPAQLSTLYANAATKASGVKAAAEGAAVATSKVGAAALAARAGWAALAVAMAAGIVKITVDLGTNIDKILQSLSRTDTVTRFFDQIEIGIDKILKKVSKTNTKEVGEVLGLLKEFLTTSPIDFVGQRVDTEIELRSATSARGRITEAVRKAREQARQNAQANAADPTRLLSDKEKAAQEARTQQQTSAQKSLNDAIADQASGVGKLLIQQRQLTAEYGDNIKAIQDLNRETAIRIGLIDQAITADLQSQRTQAISEELGGVAKIIDETRRLQQAKEKERGASLNATQKQILADIQAARIKSFLVTETKKLAEANDELFDQLNDRINQLNEQAQKISANRSDVTGDSANVLRESVRRQQDDEVRALEASRDRELANLELIANNTIQSKLQLEKAKADIETKFLNESLQKQIALLKARTELEIIEQQKRLDAFDVKGRNEIRVNLEAALQNDIATLNKKTQDEISKVTIDASVRQVQIIRDAYQKTFDQFKDGAGRIFDALLLKTESFGDAVKNILKTALLTPVREFVTSWIAALLTGQRAASGFGRVGGSSGGIAGFFGRAMGFGGGGGFSGGLAGLGNIVGGPGGTGGFSGPVTGYGGYGGGGGLGSSGVGFGGMLAAQGKGLLGMLGALGNLGRGVSSIPLGPGGTPVFNPVAGSKGVGGTAGGALLAGGGILAFDGLRRGGLVGLGETIAGGALIGAKFGGPIGALIGAGVGAVAGTIRLFIKGAVQKCKEKIKTAYGVNIQDNKLLQSFVQIAKQQYGGNLDVAIRSQQVRDIVELYAMSTGQNTGQFAQFRPPVPLTFSQSSSGALNALPTLSNGTLSAANVVGIGGGGVSQPTSVSLTLDAEATTAVLEGRTATALQKDPRMAQTAVQAATSGSYLRRDMARNLTQPAAVTR